jgi:hypothetical protein
MLRLKKLTGSPQKWTLKRSRGLGTSQLPISRITGQLEYWFSGTCPARVYRASVNRGGERSAFALTKRTPVQFSG